MVVLSPRVWGAAFGRWSK